MNALYAATAVIEVGAGLALLCVPSAAAALLLGRPLGPPAALTVARVGGAGLLTLGVTCWLARSDTQSLGSRSGGDARGSVDSAQDRGRRNPLGRTVARQPVQGQGFDALAAAHSQALAKMSGDIAAAIRAESEQNGSATMGSDFSKAKGKVIL